MYIRVLAAITLFSTAPASVAWSDDTSEASSFLTAWASNVHAIESYRVRMHRVDSSLTPDGTWSESESKYVIAANHLKQEFLVQCEHTKSQALENKPKATSLCTTAYAVSKDSGWKLECGGNVSKLANQNHVLMSGLQFPDVRHLGVMRFFKRYPPVQDLEKEMDALFAPSKPMTLRRLANGDVIIGLPTVAGDFQYVQTWVMDGQSFVPRSFVHSVKKIDGKKPATRIVSEEYKWKEFRGVLLPVEILGEELKLFSKNKGDPKQQFTVTYEAKFAWENVNDDFEIDTDAVTSAADVAKTVREGMQVFKK